MNFVHRNLSCSFLKSIWVTPVKSDGSPLKSLCTFTQKLTKSLKFVNSGCRRWGGWGRRNYTHTSTLCLFYEELEPFNHFPHIDYSVDFLSPLNRLGMVFLQATITATRIFSWRASGFPLSVGFPSLSLTLVGSSPKLELLAISEVKAWALEFSSQKLFKSTSTFYVQISIH